MTVRACSLGRVAKAVGEPVECGGEALAGVISLYEQGYWYSETDRHLIDKGLYVHPEHRDGGALDMLLDAARQTADDLGIPCYIFNLTYNAKRRRRPSRNGWERSGTILAHTPET